MKCINCGAELVTGDVFCRECGAPHSQLPPRFAEAERLFAELHARYQAGELDHAAYGAEWQKLAIEDDSGGYWTIGGDGGEWYWYDGQQWVQRDPPLADAPAERPQARPVYAPAVAPPPPPPPPPPAQRGSPWKWIALGCGGLLVVAGVVVGVLAVAGLLPFGALLPEPTSQPDVGATTTQIAADIFAIQTAAAPTDTSTPTSTLTPTSTPTVTPTPGPVTVHVAPDGSGDYSSLEEAIDAVAAESTIILEAGTYRLAEPLDIGKSLRLEGAGMDKTFVVGDDGEHVVKFTGPGSFAAEGITFRYEGTAWARVVTVDDGEIDLYRCRFTGGVWSEGEEKGGDGLLLWGSTTGLVQECRMEGNGLHGIEIQDQSQPTLEENVCTGNEQVGIRYSDSGGGVARQNECSGNGLHGISVTDQAQPTLEGNVCTGNEQVGIRYSDSGGGVARQNECSINQLSGITVNDQAQPTLEGNTCTDNEQSGIVYRDEAGGEARENECSGNQWGIHVGETAEPELVDNDCHDNTEGDVHDARPGKAPTPGPAATATRRPPPTVTPTPTETPPPVSTGPLDFPVPTQLDGWKGANGGYECTIVIHISGGAPPFTVRHDLDVFHTEARAFPIVFTAAGCSGMSHTIIVESADGQSVSHKYWIPAPWCD